MSVDNRHYSPSSWGLCLGALSCESKTNTHKHTHTRAKTHTRDILKTPKETSTSTVVRKFKKTHTCQTTSYLNFGGASGGFSTFLLQHRFKIVQKKSLSMNVKSRVPRNKKLSNEDRLNQIGETQGSKTEQRHILIDVPGRGSKSPS